METQVLEITAKAAGIGGVAIGALIIIFRETLRKAVFPRLTRQQGYRLMTLSLVLVWSVALAGIGAWVWAETAAGTDNINTTGPNSPVIQGVEGNVTITNESD